MIHRRFAILALGLAPLAAMAGADSSSTSAAAGETPALTRVGDELMRVAPAGLLGRALPYGPDRSSVFGWNGDIQEFVALPDGRWLALVSSPPLGHISLHRIESGTLRKIADLPREISLIEDFPLDLKATFDGRLFALTEILRQGHTERESRLIELDPDDGTPLGGHYLTQRVTALAASPDGFWAASEGFLRTLDPRTGKIGGPSLPLGALEPTDMDVDSSGAIWIWQEGVCSPPCSFFHRLDPATGAISEGFGTSDQFVTMQDISIDRRCQASAEAACLQGGRFRATLTYNDPGGNSGNGKVATGRSADTSLFYFFEPKNWEVMVKVLNGCAINGYFWVYGSASTDVGFTLKVQDLETGAERTYSNPLGELAKGISDGQAFACPQ